MCPEISRPYGELQLSFVTYRRASLQTFPIMRRSVCRYFLRKNILDKFSGNLGRGKANGPFLSRIQFREFETSFRRHIQHKNAIGNAVDDLTIYEFTLAQSRLSAGPLQTVRRKTRM